MAALPQGMAEGGHRVKMAAGVGAEQAVVGQGWGEFQGFSLPMESGGLFIEIVTVDLWNTNSSRADSNLMLNHQGCKAVPINQDNPFH
jgi:hypothetical protein